MRRHRPRRRTVGAGTPPASDPGLVHARQRDGWTPLHAAAAQLNERLVSVILEHGADANAPRHQDGQTPLDRALTFAARLRRTCGERFAAVASLLRQYGGELTAQSAVALGEADWLRCCRTRKDVANLSSLPGGLLTIVANQQPSVLPAVVGFRLDPSSGSASRGSKRRRSSRGDSRSAQTCAARAVRTGGAVCWTRGGRERIGLRQRDARCPRPDRRPTGTIALLQRYARATNAITAGHLTVRQGWPASCSRAEPDRDVSDDPLRGTGRLPNSSGGERRAAARGHRQAALEHVDGRAAIHAGIGILEQPLRLWSHGVNPPPIGASTWRRSAGAGAAMRTSADIWGGRCLHEGAGFRRHATADEQVAFVMGCWTPVRGPMFATNSCRARPWAGRAAGAGSSW